MNRDALSTPSRLIECIRDNALLIERLRQQVCHRYWLEPENHRIVIPDGPRPCASTTWIDEIALQVDGVSAMPWRKREASWHVQLPPEAFKAVAVALRLRYGPPTPKGSRPWGKPLSE